MEIQPKATIEKNSQNNNESEPAFREQLLAAINLAEAVNNADILLINPKNINDSNFDLPVRVKDARTKFDTLVPDKEVFVKTLRSMNENELANIISALYGMKTDLLFKVLGGISGKFGR